MAPIPAAEGAKLLILTNGSRGDVQPYMALGLGLQKAGFIVRVLTNSNLVELFERLGIEAVSSGGSSWEHELRNRKTLKEALENGDTAKFFMSMGEFNREHFPCHLTKQLEQIRGFQPDAMLCGGMDYWHTRAIGIALDIPVLFTGLQAVFPSGHQTSLFGEPRWLPTRLHLALSTFMIWLYVWIEWKEKASTMKEKIPEATPFLSGPGAHFVDVFAPTAQPVIGVSPSLNPRRPDWPETLRPVLTGAWIVPEEEQRRRMKQGAPEWGGDSGQLLWDFLDEGPAPIYLGWGSMMAGSPANTALLAVRTLMALRARGLILGGWARLNVEMLEGQPDTAAMKAYCKKHVLFVKAAPHEALFPRCAATVHHGGAATTAAALRSGVPTVVTPVFMDQFQNADIAQDNGTGFRLRQLTKVTVEELSGALQRCLFDKALRERARALGEQLREESGVSGAVKEIERFLSEDVASGRYKEAVVKQCAQIEKTNERPPGPITWLWRIFLSPKPNDIARWLW